MRHRLTGLLLTYTTRPAGSELSSPGLIMQILIESTSYGQDPGLTFTARPTVGGAFGLLVLPK